MKAVSFATLIGSVSAQMFPSCIGQNEILRGHGTHSLFTDVSMFGLSGCFLDNCQNSDKWISVSYASCADACAKTPECKHWTYGLEDGSKKCWLRTADDGKEEISGYVHGPVGCHPLEFPTCVKPDIRYGAHAAVFTDVTVEGKYDGCVNDDCTSTDVFLSPSHVDCSTVCANVDGCRFWSFGFEGDASKCWLRGDDATEERAEGFSSGRVDCAPLSAWEAISSAITNPEVRKPVAPGNNDCWGGGFNFDSCCHESHGPGGNIQCWDGNQFSHSNCCFAPTNQEL